jgi:hypothetical protein
MQHGIAITGLTDFTVPVTVTVQPEAVEEAKTVTSLPFEEAVADLQHSGESLEARGATAHKVSTLQDLERGRRLEVEEILGYAVWKGTELGVPLPTVEALSSHRTSRRVRGHRNRRSARVSVMVVSFRSRAGDIRACGVRRTSIVAHPTQVAPSGSRPAVLRPRLRFPA